MQIRSVLYIDIQVSKWVQTPAHFSESLIYPESWKAISAAKCSFELSFLCAKAWALVAPEGAAEIGRLCFFFFFSFARHSIREQLISLHCSGFLCTVTVSLSSCSWSNRNTELNAFLFFPLYFFPARSDAPKTRSSLTPFDISLLPHFNINCLPEEKQVWGAGAEHLHACVWATALLPSVPHSHRSFLWAAWTSPVLLAPDCRRDRSVDVLHSLLGLGCSDKAQSCACCCSHPTTHLLKDSYPCTEQ